MESIFTDFPWGFAGATLLVALSCSLFTANLDRIIVRITGITIGNSTPGRVVIRESDPEWTDEQWRNANKLMSLDRL